MSLLGSPTEESEEEEEDEEEELTGLAGLEKLEGMLLGMCREAREDARKKEEDSVSVLRGTQVLMRLSSLPSLEAFLAALRFTATKRSQELRRMRDMNRLLPDLQKELAKCRRAMRRFSGDQEGLEAARKKRKKKAARLFDIQAREKLWALFHGLESAVLRALLERKGVDVAAVGLPTASGEWPTCCRASFLKALRDPESELTRAQRDAMETIRGDVDQLQEESWVSLMDSALESGDRCASVFYGMLKESYGGGIPDFHAAPTSEEVSENMDCLVDIMCSRSRGARAWEEQEEDAAASDSSSGASGEEEPPSKRPCHRGEE